MSIHNFDSIVRIVNEVSITGREKELGGLFTQDSQLDGKHIHVNNKKLLHFGSCSYLGLELDARLKKAGIEALNNYGSTFSCSRIYVSTSYYKQLEESLSAMFDANIVLSSNTSLGHLSIMPIIIGSNDAVIYDQQAHISMQEASYKLKFYKTHITVLRHNNMVDLEQKILEYRGKFEKIWYVLDGVYSMFGDFPSYDAIMELLKKYKQLHLYIDDAHGMSWTGKNGTGYTLSKIELNERIVLATSLAKGFGVCSGVFIFKNKEWYDKVRLWGSALSYSGPQEPATISAAIASSKIHLSDEIYTLQENLRKRVAYCNQLLHEYHLPVISSNEGPIFFIGLGTTSLAYNLIARIKNEGFYTNIGNYPAVPESCAGLRFTLTNHLDFEDIKSLVESIAHHFPLALQEENRDFKDIVRSFRKFANLEPLIPYYEEIRNKTIQQSNKLEIKQFSSILEINSVIWNTMMEGRGVFTYNALLMLESAFSQNIERENNWKFKYLIVYQDSKPVVASFFTLALNKDDMMAPASVSAMIEEMRKNDPYYLTSLNLVMGSLITNGEHLYVDFENPEWNKAIQVLVTRLWELQEELGANTLLIRDVNPEYKELVDELFQLGFAKFDLPDNYVININQSENIDSYIENELNTKQRYQIKNEILPGIEDFKLITNKCNEIELKECYQLYLNTKRNNLGLNTFDLPYSYFETVNNNSNWEICRIYHKSSQNIFSMGLCFKENTNYFPVVFGMDYIASSLYNGYKKSLFLVIQRAVNIGAKKVHMGITAGETKRKFGAIAEKQVGFALTKDNYNNTLIRNMEN